MKNFYTSKSDRSDLRDPHLSDWNQGRSHEHMTRIEKFMLLAAILIVICAGVAGGMFVHQLIAGKP